MKYFQIQARLVAPLFVQENRQSNAARGLSYLPGATLRGALAAHYLRQGNTPEDAAFREIFLEAPVCFPDLFPSNSRHQIPRPIPMTTNSCKRAKGFLKEKGEGHGVGDMLAAMVAADMEGRLQAQALLCNTCKHDMKPLHGFWNGDIESPEACEPSIVYQRHTGIDRVTGTAASRIFYVTQGISDSRDKHPQYLSGGMYLNENQFDILSGWLTEAIFAGGDRTRGMGEIELSFKESAPPEFDLEGWDTAFREKVAGLTPKEPPSGWYFSIGLDGHAILVDRFLRPSLEIVPDFPDILPVARIVRRHSVRGWQSSRQLPKSEDTAIAMGGVYLFRYAGEDPQGLAAYLKELAIEGIGLRRAEGFGRISVCCPIHIKEVL